MQAARARALAPLLVALIAAAACTDPGRIVGGKGAPDEIITPPKGALLSGKADLRPDADPGKQAKLVMAPLEIPVEVKRIESGDKLTYQLWAHGEPFEEERYENPPDGFRLVSAAGEMYRPAIPLLKFPMNVGDIWKWEGQTVIADIGRKASALVRTSEDKLSLGGTEASALRVTVELALDGGGPTPARRQLDFWFVPGRGLLRREFAEASTREPADADK